MPKLTPAILIALSFYGLIFCMGCGTKPVTCNLPSSSSSSSTCSCGACPAQLLQYVYAAGDNGEVAAFPINESSFALETPTTTPGPASSLGAVQIGNAYLYASNPQAAGGGSIDAWTIDTATGALTAVSGWPFVLGSSAEPKGLAAAQGAEPAGEFLYVADTGKIDALQLNTGTGGPVTTVAGSPFPSGTNVYLTVDPMSRFVFAADEDAPGGVLAFTIDANTGVLTTVPGSPFAVGSNSNPVSVSQIVVDPTGSFVYVTLPVIGQVAGFSIDASSGVLTPIPGSPFSAESGAFAIAVNNLQGVTPTYVYVANQMADSISGYSIDATTGALTPVASSPFAATGVTALVTGNLDHLYAYGGSGMMVFSVDPNSGALAPVGSPIAFSGATVLTYVGP
jgi:6-phosphogluconolactonase (cycloisomerase 2 family)